MTKKVAISFRVDEEIKKGLVEISKEKDISLPELLRVVLEAFLEPKKEAPINKYEFLGDGCELRDYLDEEEAPIGKNYGEGFYCLKKAPTIMKLGSGVDTAANKICSKCLIRDTALADSKILKEQRKKGIKVNMPHCTRGGIPNEDLTEFYCPKIGRRRPIKEVREKQHKPCRLEGANNSNCFDLKYRTVISGLKEKDNR